MFSEGLEKRSREAGAGGRRTRGKWILASLLGLLCLSFLSGSQKESTPATIITIDGNGTGRVFQGIGAVSAGASSRLLIDYPEPYRSQILDYLFKPNYGASLQHLKVEIGGDVNSTDGSEPSHMRTRTDENYNRGYEWWLMEQAKARNPNLILDSLAWGAAGWIGDGKYYSQDMADYVIRFLQGAKKAHGLDIRYTGIWNEKQHDTGYVKLLKKTLGASGLTTKIVCCDLYPAQHQWTIINDMQKDLQLKAAVDVVGVHYPREKERVTTPQAAKEAAKTLWSSEDGPWRGDWEGAEALARIYNQNYIDSRMTKTEVWSPVTSYYDILAIPGSGLMYANTPWSGHYEVQPAIWATAHTTQFAQPGWQYIDSACGDLSGKGSYLTLKSPVSDDYSVIIETTDSKEKQQASLRITGGLSQGTVHVWRTTVNSSFEHISDITPHGGSFIITLDPDSLYSLTTTTGQDKGKAVPPPFAPFPFPYTENYEGTDVGRSPRYFADQDGAFEVQPCTGRRGRCLRQIVAKKPIPWGPIPDPYTLLGSVDWTDYSVVADALLEEEGAITLLGRIDSADSNSKRNRLARWPSAYVLVLHSDGNWELNSASYTAPPEKLASGKMPSSLRAWRHLALTFHGMDIQAAIDGTVVAQVKNESHKAGMAGIGCGWNKAEFDNFGIR